MSTSTPLRGDVRNATLDQLADAGLHIHAVAYFPAEEALGNGADTRTMKAPLNEVSQTYPYERFVLSRNDVRHIHRKGFYPHLADTRDIVFQVVVTGSRLQLVSPEGMVATKIRVRPNEWFGIAEPGKRSWKMRLRYVKPDPDRPEGDVLLAEPDIRTT